MSDIDRIELAIRKAQSRVYRLNMNIPEIRSMIAMVLEIVADEIAMASRPTNTPEK